MTGHRRDRSRFDPYEMMADLQRRHATAAATLADMYPEWSAWTVDDLGDVIEVVSRDAHLRATPAPPVLRAHLTRAIG